MENITAQTRAKIFAAYMPCQIKITTTGDFLELSGISFDQMDIQINGVYGDDWWSLKNIYKLSLIPLSKITKKDAKAASKLSLMQSCDFLRSKGYDCGYGNIPSLIEAGIAVEKP